ncbi:hypothetical protein BJK06_08265 [Curtobacterium sp. BH-2-1-1]|nr:hypothetical protein BJK06_08265 [Curtobacterium sp. BH-2-1-1]
MSLILLRSVSGQVVPMTRVLQAASTTLLVMTSIGLSLVDVAAHLVAVDTRSCTDVHDTMCPVLARCLQEIDDKIARLQQLHGRLTQAEQDFAE